MGRLLAVLAVFFRLGTDARGFGASPRSFEAVSQLVAHDLLALAIALQGTKNSVVNSYRIVMAFGVIQHVSGLQQRKHRLLPCVIEQFQGTGCLQSLCHGRINLACSEQVARPDKLNLSRLDL